MRAARRIMEADDPARFAADFAAEKEQRELADLIDNETAAPDLLAVLRQVTARLETVLRHHGGTDTQIETHPELSAARNLIARAEGRTN